MKDTVKMQGGVRMIAHRGLSGLERENTLAAFVAAGQRSYYGVETDVHVTADGEIIVFHDDDLNRLAGIDKVVEECTFAELRAIRLRDLEGNVREDLCLPSLEEYISVCRYYDKQAILELKNPMAKEKVWEIGERIEKMGYLEKTTFISFAGENLVYLREKFPQAQAQFLCDECMDADIAFMQENDLDADVYGEFLTAERVEKLRKANCKINVWTVDDPVLYERMVALGVDFITSNILE